MLPISALGVVFGPSLLGFSTRKRRRRRTLTWPTLTGKVNARSLRNILSIEIGV
jgi:hypothetical protein